METTDTENKPYEFKVQRKFNAAEIARGVDSKNEVISIDVVDAGYRTNGVMGHKVFLAVYSRKKNDVDKRGEIFPLVAMFLGGLEVSVKEVEAAAPLGILHYVQASEADVSLAKQNRKICLLQLMGAGYETDKPKRVLSTSLDSVRDDRLSLPRNHF